jgi:3-oxoadipate enol-lactonase/4-carboxymuconolactone decarboxylase
VTAVTLHYRIDGPPGAPPLLLGGSLGTNLSMWEPQLEALTQSHRVIRFDTRGHGESPATPGPYTLDQLGRDVQDLMIELAISRADYVGLSIGGMIGLWLAINQPRQIRRLVVICSSAKVDGDAFRARAATVLEAGTPAVVADAVIERWFTPAFARENPAVLERMRAMIAATPAAGYAGCCEAIAAMDLRDRLHTIIAPTLVIGGAQDPALPAAEHSAPLARAIPDARYELLDPAAHIASVERAQEVNELILSHLDPGVGAVREQTDKSRHEQGMRVRREVLGDAHVDRAITATTEFTAPFQDFITRVAWGDIWSRPGLDRRTRSAITLAALTALGREGELELHVRAAIRNGLKPEEISEVLLHTAIYAGVPATNAALALARRVLTDDGVL